MSSDHPGVRLAATVTTAASLSFVPVAIHFNLFATLVRIAKAATVDEIVKASDESRSEEAKKSAPLCLQLAKDTLFAMAGLRFVDMPSEDVYLANDITKYMILTVPSAQDGALHFTTEALFAGAFLMRKLVDTKFEYPFKERDTPMQYAYKMMGNEKLANEHTYSIMHLEGRMDSFNKFMEGKFVKIPEMPKRVKGLGYDLDAAIKGNENPVAMVDIGGGRGELLLQVKEAYPHLEDSNLVLQEFNAEIGSVPGVTVMDWNFKDDSPQPIQGAMIYSLAHIFHNLPDLDALALLQKLANAMAPHSRLLVHEFTKNLTYSYIEATMMLLYGGRIRSSREWSRLAALSGLGVTFEAYPPVGEGLIELRKI
ncbi:hypothetical protein FQN50_006040 [Emmonsiellopsis sp. PD_5]|nr:hypothetical protein FQN50_006040 [Emmonsiellopsis sp. PD_5]